MQERNKTVVGKYDTRDEALEVVRKLKDAGYQKENIILYANEDVTQTQSDYEAVNIEADTNKDTMSSRETNEDDQSLWEQIKGAFSSDTYDHDEQRRDDNYDKEDDLLYPYRDDIKNGKVIVVLDGYKGEDLNKYNSAAEVGDKANGTPPTTPVTSTENTVSDDDLDHNTVDRDHDKMNKADLDTTDEATSNKADLNNYSGVRSNDPDKKADVNDPLTDGRDFSREDDDMDGFKK